MIPERLTPKQLAETDLTDLSAADMRALVSRGTVLEQQARALEDTDEQTESDTPTPD